MTEIVISAMADLFKFVCVNGPLQSIVMPDSATDIDTFDVSINNLSTATLSDILITLNSYGTSGGGFDGRAQSPPAPLTSGPVIDAIIELMTRSWTVLYDF
jgi:hypothetical protein